MRYSCLICGYKTLDSYCDWDICPICFWEDDVLHHGGDKTSPANSGLKVSQAQANFMMFRCCSTEHQRFVRGPLPTEEHDPVWQTLPEAVRLAEEMQRIDVS